MQRLRPVMRKARPGTFKRLIGFMIKNYPGQLAVCLV